MSDVGALTTWPRKITVGSRLAFVAGASAFALMLTYVYIDFVSVKFGYLGFPADNQNFNEIAYAVFLAILPSFFLPLIVQRVSTFVIGVLYFTVYIPVLIIPVIEGILPKTDQFLLLHALLISIFILIAAGAPGVKRPNRRLSPALFWWIFGAAYVALNAYVLIVFGASLKFSGFDDIYTQRAAASDVLDQGAIGYAIGMLAGAMNPFLLSLGLASRRKLFIAIAVAGQVFIYTTAAAKAVLISIILIPGFYVLVFNKNEISLMRVSLPFIITMFIFSPLLFVGDAIDSGNIIKNVVALIYMRTFCIPGALTGIYAQFFQDHPMTFYSHSLVGRYFSHFPYNTSIGQEIGEYILSGSSMNTNANFLATDGIAAIGLPGIILISVVLAFVLRAIDNFFGRRHLPVVCGALLPTMISLGNTSLFATMLTGGTLVLLVILIAWQRTLAAPE